MSDKKLNRKDRLILISVLMAILIFMVVRVDDVGASLAEYQIAKSPLQLCMRAKGYVFDEKKDTCKPDIEACYHAYSWLNSIKEH
jgi:divalent metal cation (Fe/Co/Zn/Cd) transporter